MKRLIFITTTILSIVLFSTAYSQTSGVLWIKTFAPGSTSLNDSSVDHEALAALDELMKDEDMDVTFLGAADSVGWVFYGKSVHTHISEAWNDAKRLGRARALRARYERGNVGITHENIAGVKVSWRRRKSDAEFDHELTEIRKQNENLNDKLAKLEQNIEDIQQPSSPAYTNSPGYLPTENNSYFDWFLQGGFWTWQASSGSLLTPSVALGIIINQTSFIIQGGVSPWHITTPQGNQSESFFFMGVKHMKTNKFGISVGAFRGWKFFTETDDWSFKTTGLSAGVVIKHSIFEFNPMLSYTDSNSIFEKSDWKLGTTLGFSININEAF